MGAPNATAIDMLSYSAPIRAMGASLGAPVADVPSFTATVRNADHTAGEAKVKEVIDVCDFYSGTLGSTPYLLIVLDYGPVYLGLDENNRHRWSLTFRITKRRS